MKGKDSKEDDELLPCPWIVDVTQSLHRRPWSESVRSMCSSSVFYSFPSQRCFQAKEHLQLLGWPTTVATHFLPEAQIRDLAGESMAMPAIALAAAAAILCLPDTTLWEQIAV